MSNVLMTAHPSTSARLCATQVLQPAGSNTLYTFDFFVPKNFVMGDSFKHPDGRYPSRWSCKDAYDTW